MYVETPEEAVAMARELRAKMRSLTHVEVALAPSFVLLPSVAEALARSAVAVGAQTLSASRGGSHTGDVSAAMLKAVGASFAIVGHSERRLPAQAGGIGESNEIVRAQILEAADAKLGVVLCVGERERDLGGDHFTVIKEQLTSALTNLPKQALSKLVVAYEPVWAIGKSASEAMKPTDVHEAVIFIRKTLTAMLEPAVVRKIPIIYGGSVEAENASALLAEGGVSGFLVGRASTSLETFLPILKACK